VGRKKLDAANPGTWTYEQAAWAQGAQAVAGVDEVGRGPLAGPVVAAAVILDPAKPIAGVRDSKRLTPEQREALLPVIYRQAVAVGIGQVDAAVIDEINILQAALRAMREAVTALSVPPDWVLVDGPRPVPGLPCGQTLVVKGDALSPSIAAASIVAKVTRDRLLVELDALYPGYGLAQHKGYPTPQHLASLERLGVSPIHRRSFGPVRRRLEGEEEGAHERRPSTARPARGRTGGSLPAEPRISDSAPQLSLPLGGD